MMSDTPQTPGERRFLRPSVRYAIEQSTLAEAYKKSSCAPRR
jgi:hypothetical protein